MKYPYSFHKVHGDPWTSEDYDVTHLCHKRLEGQNTLIKEMFNKENSWPELHNHFDYVTSDVIEYKRTPERTAAFILKKDNTWYVTTMLTFNENLRNRIYNEIYTLLLINWHYSILQKKLGSVSHMTEADGYIFDFKKEYPLINPSNKLICDILMDISIGCKKLANKDGLIEHAEYRVPAVIDCVLLDYANKAILGYKEKVVKEYCNGETQRRAYKRVRAIHNYNRTCIWNGIWMFSMDLINHLDCDEYVDNARTYWDFYQYSLMQLPEAKVIKERYFDKIDDRYVKCVLAYAFSSLTMYLSCEIRDVMYAVDNNNTKIRNRKGTYDLKHLDNQNLLHCLSIIKYIDKQARSHKGTRFIDSHDNSIHYAIHGIFNTIILINED